MVFNFITANSAKWGEMLDVNIHKTNKVVLALKRKKAKARTNAKKSNNTALWETGKRKTYFVSEIHLIWKDLFLLDSPKVHPQLKTMKERRQFSTVNDVFRYSLNVHWLSGIKLKHCRSDSVRCCENLINTSAPSHWLKSVAWPVGPVLKFRDIPDWLIDKYVHCYKEKIYASFVDFRKAFGSVWHDGLLYKLSKINVQGKFDRLIKGLYTKCTCSVRIGNNKRDLFNTQEVCGKATF